MGMVMERLKRAYESIESRIPFEPACAVILGSGLGMLAQELTCESRISYKEIEGFPVSTVAGHDGCFIFTHTKSGLPIVMASGRVHYYEGYEMSEVVMPVRLMKMMGAKTLVLSNAAGGAGAHLEQGDLMLITDQIASFVPSPLRGSNEEELGTRFPDMSEIYTLKLRELMKQVASTQQIYLKEGVYIQLPGPQYETPMEVQMCIKLGADAIGMSTACEAIAARHMGMQVCGVSLITNKACGLSANVLSHEEVQECARVSGERFVRLMLGFLDCLSDATHK